MNKSAFYKDIGRTLKNNMSRFIAITVMAALGIGVFSGFAVGCLDTLEAADHFYDKQNAYDIKIVSTLGLTQEELSVISKVKGVNSVFGSCSRDVKAELSKGNSLLTNLNALDTNGMNMPYVFEGELPTQSGQIAVNSKFIEDSGLKVGDSITLSSEVPELGVNKYEITAVILSPLNISNTKKGIASVSFTSSSSDYMMYATTDCINSSIYNAIYVTLEGASKLDCYSSEYQKLVDSMTATIESSIQENRLQARYEEVVSDAKAKDINISMVKWYVWDRSDNDSSAGLKKDVSFIQEVTKAFPIIFFLVAVLISLTTMTRMVEEDRGLIGTYKSLGYSNYQISMKYVFYALLACVIGGSLGSVIGFVVLPMVIRIIMNSLYVLPTFQLSFNIGYGLSGFLLFLLGIVGATAISCAEMLHQRPAELMRPKAPKAGSRILLERLPFIWKRLNFLNKVTCRNLFRYKKRAIMTIVGILGCSMLIVLGFGVKDSVGGLMSDQFDNVTVYHAIVVTDNLPTEKMKILTNEWKESKKVKDELQLQINTLTLRSSSDSLDITVMVIPDGADLGRYVHLYNSRTHKAMTLPQKGIVVTQNAAKKLALEGGDIVSMQNEDNMEYNFPVAFVAENYAGNYVYISEGCYQEAFGDYKGTSFLLNLTNNTDGQKWLETLSEDERILSVSSSQAVRDAFSDVNKLINMVVYLLIGMSAILALTVLFTLSNINISERIRELATIKVLGFQKEEVYSYVNRETFILTLFGILCGLPAGFGITYGILINVSIANIAFKVRVSLISYLIAVVITLFFALSVNKVTNKALRRINMVEALKSVE